MDHTLLLTVKSYEFDAGSNTTNPLGFMIRILTQEDERLGIYFGSVEDPVPKLLGWRASDGALVVFLQRRDYASYVLLLDQVKAAYIKVMLVDSEDGGEDITRFELSSAQFPADTRLGESDVSEFNRRAARP
jgi:hypothetical protein